MQKRRRTDSAKGAIEDGYLMPNITDRAPPAGICIVVTMVAPALVFRGCRPPRRIYAYGAQKKRKLNPLGGLPEYTI